MQESGTKMTATFDYNWAAFPRLDTKRLQVIGGKALLSIGDHHHTNATDNKNRCGACGNRLSLG